MSLPFDESLLRPCSEDDIRHVLWHFSFAGGYEPGAFTKNLMKAIAFGDAVNQGILGTVYPGLVTAMITAQRINGGVEALQGYLETFAHPGGDRV